MSVPSEPENAFLVIAVLVAEDADPGEVEEKLAGEFGPVLMRTPFASFDETAYYAPEMGEGIRRGFMAFEKLVDPGTLADVKTATNAMEKTWERGGRRAVNLDPGILTLGNLVLASGKPAAHRIYLGRGIHGEIEYLYRFGRFVPVEWTYPDYRDERVAAWFGEVRNCLKNRRKGKECLKA